MHSTAGGIGSGVSSSAMEALRDKYPKSYIINASVLPFEKGDSSFSTYNTLLNLSWIQKYSDGCLVLPNSELALKAAQSKSTHQNPKSFTEFGGINDLIKNLLSGILMPARHSPGNIGNFNGWTLLQTMTPLVKFFGGISTGSIDQLLCWQNYSCRRCLAAQLYLRTSSYASLEKIRSRTEASLDFVEWNQEGLDVVIGEHSKSTPECTLLYNTASYINPIFKRMIDDAEAKLKYRAFLHWLSVKDIQFDLQDSLNSLKSTLDAYAELSIF